MGEPTTLAEYRELTQQQRKNVKKTAIQNILDAVVTDNGTNPDSNVIEKLDKILEELKDIKEKNLAYDNEVKRLKNVVDNQNKILTAHQRFMEEIDREKRANDLIVLGLPENEEDDKANFAKVLTAININPANVDVVKFTRLGKREEGNLTKNRPLKVSLEQKSKRWDILKNAKKLKDLDEGDPLKKVFLKPDVHPEIRKEEKRLYEVFKAEKANKDNTGIEVLYDRKKRIVTRNGEEVDSFRLFSSFH